MSFAIRYMDKNYEIHEDFLTFINCHEKNYDGGTQEPVLTGEILGQIAINFLKDIGLTEEKCVCIGTDTCGIMLSDQKGAVSEITERCRNAIKCTCNHTLN
ncbi:hypothetical protein JTB14_021658 [Gonioctena quinquepunctata]|nr:hypothetical protein JTB14_021658 [Gonioctena quinquepunctata]